MVAASRKEREKIKPTRLGYEVFVPKQGSHTLTSGLPETHNETKTLAGRTAVTEGRFQEPALQGVNQERRQGAFRMAGLLTTGKKHPQHHQKALLAGVGGEGLSGLVC